MKLITTKYINIIFSELAQYASRGNSTLFFDLKAALIKADESHSSETLFAWINEYVASLTVTEHINEDEWYIESLKQGGMSEGILIVSYWQDTMLPILKQRCEQIEAGLQFAEQENISDLIFIGDVHGRMDKLDELLNREVTDEKMVFIGDLIDNGEGQQAEHLALLNKVKTLVDDKQGYCLMGNHEFNAIGWFLQKADGSYCRDRSKPGNIKQHKLFLKQIGEDSVEHAKWIEWFKSLPLFLNFGSVTAIHACWHQPSIDSLRPYLNKDNSLKTEHWFNAFDKEHELYRLIETLLKGLELCLPQGSSFFDKNSIERHDIRVAWWKDECSVSSYRDLAMVADEQRASIPDIKLPTGTMNHYAAPLVPVVVGHYTLAATAFPERLSEKVVCVDYNAAKNDNPLIAFYASCDGWWDCPTELTEQSGFVHVNEIQPSTVITEGVNNFIQCALKALPDGKQAQGFDAIVAEILFKQWDPIGVYDPGDMLEEMSSEYASYEKEVIKLAQNEEPALLAAYLLLQETHSMLIEREKNNFHCTKIAYQIIEAWQSYCKNPPQMEIEDSTFIARAQGALLGLAIGDALGTTLEFKAKDNYTPLIDMVGGGPFSLQAGQWTDDTSMALCLADSLLATGRCDSEDQIKRYVRWWKEGDNSVTGHCFDIGNTVSSALRDYLSTGDPQSGTTDQYSAGNGSLMRLAPLSIFYAPSKGVTLNDALEFAKQSSLTTHGETRAYQACQVMAWLLYQLFSYENISKEALLSNLATSFDDLHPELMAITQGAFLQKTREQVFGTGFVVQSLEAALWAFANSNDFKEGALLAANLGDDADTTAAIYGQLAGACYGVQRLPEQWLERVAWQAHIAETASMLATVPIISEGESPLLQFFEKTEKRDIEAALYQWLYQQQYILREFDWPSYQHKELVFTGLEKPNSPLAQQKIEFLNEMSYCEALKVITTVIRADRFCDGLWDDFKRDGSLRLWLERLISFSYATVSDDFLF